jgi:hypothetical protein
MAQEIMTQTIEGERYSKVPNEAVPGRHSLEELIKREIDLTKQQD